MTVIVDGISGVTFPNLSTQAIAGLTSANPQSGGVIQVIQAIKTDTFSTTSSSFVTITGLTATITPKFATSKILIICQISYSGQNGTSTNFKITGGNTATYVGNASGSNQQGVFGGYFNNNETGSLFSGSIVYLDSPATTSATTYSVQTSAGSTGLSNPSLINISIQTNGANYVSGSSSITVMEIAA